MWDDYYYEKNMQGDIVRVYNSDGVSLVSYVYTAWGEITSTTYHNSGANTTVTNNPFTYRGYYYDRDLGLYCTSTRYYDSNIGRWISPDSVMSGVGGDISGYNLYAYCFNNPVNMVDHSGNWPSLNDIGDWWEDNVVEPIEDLVEEAENAVNNWKEESFVNNVIYDSITADAGVGIGVGGEIEMGLFKVSAISRVDILGVEKVGFENKWGFHGKSAIGVGYGNFYVGSESKTYESYDGTEKYDYQNSPEIAYSFGVEIGVVVAVHASASISFSQMYNNFINYGKEHGWWE